MMQYKRIFLVYFLTLFSYTSCIQDEDNSDNENSYIDVHQHPKSSFSCEGKRVGEYYSDLSTQCQLYYVCLPNAQLKLSPTSFACPNTTRFNQATRVCSPADQVYCNIAERYYENIHGGIDTKDQRPNLEYLGADFDKTPWQINKKAGKSLIVPLNLEPEYKVQTERPRLPSPRTIPKENQFTNNNLAKADSPLHTSFSLTFNQPQNPRIVARTRASITNSRRGSNSETLPNSLNSNQASNRFKPSTNSNTRSRLPIYSNTPNRNTILLQPSTIATTPSTTTTTTTAAPLIVENLPPKTDAKSGDYIYDYVEYDAPASNNGNNAQPAGLTANTANKPPSLPAIPNLDEASPNVRNTNAVSTSNSNLGSLFSSTISHQPLNNANQQQPRISSTSSTISTARPTQRNNSPQSNYFNTNNPFSNNPFSSNPFASNPFASNSGSLSRQKREDNDETSSILKVDNQNNRKEIYGEKEEDGFTCRDKLSGVGYSDIGSQCRSFHICLPVSKGKYKDYQLFCSEGMAYNQYTANCEQIDKFDCKRSRDYYLYNKEVNLDSYLKNKFRISKQLADIKN